MNVKKKCRVSASPETATNKETIDQHDIQMPEFVRSPEAKPSDCQDCVRKQQELWNEVKGNKTEIESKIKTMDEIFTTMCATLTMKMTPKTLSFDVEKEKDQEETEEENKEENQKTTKSTEMRMKTTVTNQMKNEVSINLSMHEKIATGVSQIIENAEWKHAMCNFSHSANSNCMSRE